MDIPSSPKNITPNAITNNSTPPHTKLNSNPNNTFSRNLARALETPAAQLQKTSSTATRNMLSHTQLASNARQTSNTYWSIQTGEPMMTSRLADKASLAIMDTALQVQSTLNAAGISLNPPIDFKVSADGLAVGNHPMAPQIQALMTDHPDLFKQYRDALLMTAHATVLQRAEQSHTEYYTAYDHGHIHQADQMIKRLRNATPIEVGQRFGNNDIELILTTQVPRGWPSTAQEFSA